MAVGTALKTYSFTLTLSGTPEVTDESLDTMLGPLLAARCDDASLSSEGQTVYLGFDRQAESLGEAVGSAIAAVVRAGFGVSRIEVEGEK